MPVAKGETIDVERTREKLLRAAAEVFYRDGTSAGVNELAQRAGVSKVSLYRHFGSKEELIEAVLRRRSDHVVAWLREAADAPSDPSTVSSRSSTPSAGGTPNRGSAAARSSTPPPRARPRAASPATTSAAIASCSPRWRRTRQPPTRRSPAVSSLILLEGATVVAALTGDLDAAGDARRLAETILTPRPR